MKTNGSNSLTDVEWKESCEADGGQLAQINSDLEQQVAHSVIKASGEPRVLIDCKRKERGSPIFVTSDNKPISFK